MGLKDIPRISAAEIKEVRAGNPAQDLRTAAARLEKSTSEHSHVTYDLKRRVLAERAAEGLTVEEIASAIGRLRNFVDSLWSRYPDKDSLDAEPGWTKDAALACLREMAATKDVARRKMEDDRSHRNRLVATVYAAQIPDYGPGAISADAGIDRNHVLRIARTHGIAPVHRPDVRNQYSKGREYLAEARQRLLDAGHESAAAIVTDLLQPTR